MRKKYVRECMILSAAVMAAASGCAKQEAAPATTAAESTAAEESTEAAKEEQPSGQENETGERWTAEYSAAYLKNYFGVELTEDDMASGGFAKALAKVAGEQDAETEETETEAADASETETTEGETEAAKAETETEEADAETEAAEDVSETETADAAAADGAETPLDDVKAVVIAADYEELALSYPAEKAQERLAAYGVTCEDEDYAAYLACALDTELIDAKEAAAAAAGEAMTAEEASQVLMAVVDANGDGSNYLGMSDDADIYGKLDHAWNEFIIFDDPELTEIGKQAVFDGITTGYGIKSDAYSARFLPELTLQYGHSDIKHAHQLIGLLNSENLTAKVQLEPKISIYEYLTEWGDPAPATPTYEVRQYGDRYLVFTVEYDMQLEFGSKEDMVRFDQVVKDYAKKNEGNEEAVGLIYQSWWQPLYSTVRDDMPEEDFHPIVDCVVAKDGYSIHPFTTVEQKDQVVSAFQKLAGDIEVVPVNRWCNTAFYNYLTGADYQ